MRQFINSGAVALALLAAAGPAQADEAALKAEVEQLRAEVAALKDAVHEMQTQRSAVAAVPVAAVAPSATVTAVPVAGTAPAPAQASAGGEREATTLWGYGELNYNHPSAHAADAQADLRRAVLGFSHSFDESTHVYGELEWEHAVTS